MGMRRAFSFDWTCIVLPIWRQTKTSWLLTNASPCWPMLHRKAAYGWKADDRAMKYTGRVRAQMIPSKSKREPNHVPFTDYLKSSLNVADRFLETATSSKMTYCMPQEPNSCLHQLAYGKLVSLYITLFHLKLQFLKTYWWH